MTTGTVPEDVKAYLDAVRARLDDLPADERDDLLADVEASIVESVEGSDAPVERRLGPPQAFADELRAAAGLPPRAVAPGAATRTGLRERLAAVDEYLATNPTGRRLRELAPLWWLLRAVVAVGLLEIVVQALSSEAISPLGGPNAGRDAALLLLGLAVAVPVSLVAGLRRPRRGTAVVLVNVVLALATVPVLAHAVAGAQRAVSEYVGAVEAPAVAVPAGLVHDGAPVQNVYAFDRDGRLLRDVRLFAEDGRPLAIGAGSEDPDRRAVTTRDGETVFNAFPIRYFEPGTQRVADPTAGAPARPSPLATEPLDDR